VTGNVKADSIHVVEPASSDIDSYINQKSTFTFANDALRFGWRNGVNGARQWKHGNGSQFSLPLNHIRRERSRCVEFTSRATHQPEILYDKFKTAVRDIPPPFLISLRNGLIFGAGNVMLSCGSGVASMLSPSLADISSTC